MGPMDSTGRWLKHNNLHLETDAFRQSTFKLANKFTEF